MSSNKILKCENCYNILSVNQVIDQETHLFKNALICQKCQKALALNTLKSSYSYLNESELKLKITLQELLESLNITISKLSKKINEFSLTQYNHFENIRRSIDIQREMMIQEKILRNKTENELCEINNQSDDMIKNVELIEEAFRKNFNKNVKPYLIDINIEMEINYLEELFRNPDKIHKALKLKVLYDKKLDEYQKKLSNFSLFEFDLIKNKFQPSSDFQVSSLGKLELFSNFLNSTDETMINIITCDVVGNEVKILNLNTNSIIRIFSGHMEKITCLVILNEENKLITGSEDKSIKIWDLLTSKCLKTLNAAHVFSLRCLKTLTKKKFASGASDCIKIWDLNRDESEFTLGTDIKYGGFNCIEQLSNENIVSCVDDFSIRIFNITTRENISILRGHSHWIKCLLVLSEDMFASGSNDMTVKIWNFLNGQCLKTFYHCTPVSHIDILANNILISCSTDGAIQIRDLKNYECKILGGRLNTCYLKCDQLFSKRLISCSKDRSIQIWDLNSNECIKTIQADFAITKFEFCTQFFLEQSTLKNYF